MNHYVYRIDRPATGEWYIGIRSCAGDPRSDTRYMGSGVRVRRIKRDELVKTILVQVETREEAARLEAALVNARAIADPLCLNIIEGGGLGFGTPGMKHSEETRAKISEANHRRAPQTPATRRKRSESLKGVTKSAAHKQASGAAQRGVPKSETHKQALRDVHRRRAPHSEETKSRMRFAQQARRAAEADK